jgi:hypothetical protein
VAVARRVRGPGCGDGHYLQLRTPAAYVCEADMVASDEPAAGSDPAPGRAPLPHEYLSAKREGVRVYAHPQDAPTDEYDTVLGKGFSVVAVDRVRRDGEVFVHTAGNRYIRERDLRPVRGSAFSGAQLSVGALRGLAFVIADDAPVLARPDGAVLRKLPRLSRVHVVRAVDHMLALRSGGLVAAAHVTRPRPAPPPDDLKPGERWIDVDLERQTLVAYEGARPVFATLVSTGKRRRKTTTPRGEFRIWVKLLSSDMRDRERPELQRRYGLQAVPWVQYFEGSYGLHAAFWHERFGQPMSQGCVNLSPADARTLFHFTRPKLPQGWEAILPADPAEATRVVVH